MSHYHIEVSCATQARQMLISCVVVEGTTLIEAITQSNILSHFPAIDLTRNKVGIFGKIVSLSHKLRDKDRVEIYHPLLIDPKQARKLREKKR